MSANNNGTLQGRIVRDPEQKGGGVVTLFTLAVDGWDSNTKAKSADFFRCVAFGKTGETIFQYAKKGREVTIQTHLKVRQWEDPTSGQKREEVSIVVDDVRLGHDPNRSPGPRTSDPLPFGDDPNQDPFSLI